MRESSVDDVCSAYSSEDCFKTTFDLGDHSSADDSFVYKILDVVLVENGDDVI